MSNYSKLVLSSFFKLFGIPFVVLSIIYYVYDFSLNSVVTAVIYSVLALGCLLAVIVTFKLNKNIKLATYASRCIENEILMFLRKKSKMKVEVSLDEPLKMDYDGNELLLSDVLGSDPNEISENLVVEEKKEALYKAIEGLKPRERLILKMRFGLFECEEMTQKDVADTLGISQSNISRLEKRIIKKLHSKLTK